MKAYTVVMVCKRVCWKETTSYLEAQQEEREELSKVTSDAEKEAIYSKHSDDFSLVEWITSYYTCKKDLLTNDNGEGLMLRDGTRIYCNSAFRAKSKQELLRKLNAYPVTRILDLDIVRYYGTDAGASRKIRELEEG